MRGLNGKMIWSMIQILQSEEGKMSKTFWIFKREFTDEYLFQLNKEVEENGVVFVNHGPEYFLPSGQRIHIIGKQFGIGWEDKQECVEAYQYHISEMKKFGFEKYNKRYKYLLIELNVEKVKEELL